MARGQRRRRRRRPEKRARASGKGKKARYLSLSDLMVKAEVGATPPRSGCEEAGVKPEEEDARGDGQQRQVEPFAPHHHHEASTLFEALPAPSLSDILGPSPSPSPDGAGSGASGLPGADEEDLPRRALRGRERWVYCSGDSSFSPASTPPATATATTSSPSPPCSSSAASTGASARSLLLKLDYEEILAAWADRGPLYIGAGSDLQLDAAQVASGRAERVRRYKEKRRRRLFAKRIRYEVRRANAVKRPRFKGRFIKEEDDEGELRPTQPASFSLLLPSSPASSPCVSLHGKRTR